MNIEELKNVNLTEKDFDLIVEALDNLPNKDTASDMFSHLMISMLVKDDENAKKEIMQEKAKEKVKKDFEKKVLTEEIRMLQGKLISVKRFMRENRLMKEVDDALGYKP